MYFNIESVQIPPKFHAALPSVVGNKPAKYEVDRMISSS